MHKTLTVTGQSSNKQRSSWVYTIPNILRPDPILCVSKPSVSFEAKLKVNFATVCSMHFFHYYMYFFGSLQTDKMIRFNVVCRFYSTFH